LYYELSQYLPDVGMCHGGMRNKQMGNRVKLYSFDSLHHSRGDADLLIIDECHEAATDDAAEQLAAYDKSINIGFSATHNMRLDNKDIRVEAMCGTIAMRITYQMAVRYGLVVPIEVVWSDVTMDVDPIAGVTDTVTRKRLGLWRNSTRNEIIAADARDESADGTQVLVVCETIEHLLFLKKRLPDFEVIYAAEGIKQEDISHFRNLGIWPESLPMMTAERRSKITKDFEDGRLRKVICNTVWNVGVNFRELGVVIRADAGDSPTGDTQIPGRAARINDQTGKTIGRIRDYRDLWNRGFNQRSGNRSRRYAYHGWRQFDNTGRLLVDDNQNGFSGFRSKSQRSRNPLNLNLATSKKPPVRKPQTQTKEST
jgi:superfamily II DNA or RNA helicase